MDTLNSQGFFGVDDWAHLGRVILRLGVALVLGMVVGLQRERTGKAAGMRTHMLVAVGACLFVLAPDEAGAKVDHLMRVVQGLAAGIGFLGAGAILKMEEARQIHGLTTAASIWVMAAVGMAVGLGMLWPAVLAVLLSELVLTVVHRLERWLAPHDRPREK